MKILATLLSFSILVSSTSPKETYYTASTPAASIVRAFLGISLTDSIDFIRWKLSITDVKYFLECNYGVGKPNTNGFYEGGKKVSFNGTVKREKNIYTLQNGNKVLKFIELNNNLLHILNSDNSLLIGGGGWSYAMNNMSPSLTNQVSLTSKPTTIKDSIAFQGRTPCGVPGVIPAGKLCYKLKWYLVFKSNNTYRLLGTGYRAEGGRKGKWDISSKEGKIMYQLYDEKGEVFIHLLKLDDGVLIFTDEKGNLLVGDHDFSYTMNREF
jgi:hypothetical protein